MLMTYSPNDLPHLRQVVDPSLAGLPTLQLRSTIDTTFGEGTADTIDDDLEGFLSDWGRTISRGAQTVGRFVQREGPGLAQIGGGIVQGAMAGSAAGLPGIIAGAATGGVGAGLSRYGSGTARQIGNALTGITGMVGQFTPMGRAGGAVGGTIGSLGQGRAGITGALGSALGGLTGSGGAGGKSQLGGLLSSPQAAGLLSGLFGNGTAAGQLSAAMGNPAVQQALAALKLGQWGRSSIPVGPGRHPVPTAVFPQMLSHLALQAATEAYAGEGMKDAESLSFMSDGAGEFSGDPASPVDRAARLWDILNEGTAEQLLDTMGFESADGENLENDGAGDWRDDESDADYYDQLDLAELAEMEDALEIEPRHEW